jgi:hypothetical protein
MDHDYLLISLRINNSYIKDERAMKNNNLIEQIDEQILTGSKLVNGILTVAVIHYTVWVVYTATRFIYNLF